MVDPMAEVHTQNLCQGAQGSEAMESAVNYTKIQHLNGHLFTHLSLIHPSNNTNPYLL